MSDRRGAPLVVVDHDADPEQNQQVVKLRKLHAAFERLMDGAERNFRPGDLVCWKPGLANNGSMLYGQPLIVVAVLDPPVFDASYKSNSPYFREPLDLQIGYLDNDGDLMIFHHDSRRFQPYRGPDLG